MAKRKAVQKPQKPQKPEDFYLSLLSRGERKAFSMKSPYDERLGKVIQALADNILDFSRSRVTDPEMLALMQPGRVVVTTIPQATVQALTVWMEPVHSIAVNVGLMMFMYRVARALAPQMITRGPGDPPAPPESEAVSIVATLIDWMSSPARAPLVEDWPAGEREVRTADNIATACERFVVAHEIAHILRQHLIADSGKVDASKTSVGDLDTRPHVQEIEADIVGALMSIESMMDQQLDPRAGALGVAMFLQCLRLAEAVGAIVVDDSHPAAEERFALVWDALPGRFGAHFGPITSWADQMVVLVQRIGQQALQLRGERRRDAIARMDEIFRTHPGMRGVERNPVADKRLLDDTLALTRTAPSAVLEAIAVNLLDAADFAKVPARDDRARRHSIAHFFARYLPPAVREVLGVEAMVFETPARKP
jgi:hypothetical protein